MIAADFAATEGSAKAIRKPSHLFSAQSSVEGRFQSLTFRGFPFRMSLPLFLDFSTGRDATRFCVVPRSQFFALISLFCL